MQKYINLCVFQNEKLSRKQFGMRMTQILRIYADFYLFDNMALIFIYLRKSLKSASSACFQDGLLKTQYLKKLVNFAVRIIVVNII
jgi:hypothetical protein